MMRLHVYDPRGVTYLGFLDAAAEMRYLTELSGAGAGSFALAASDPHAALVAPQRLVRVDLDNTTVGWWVIERIRETLIDAATLKLSVSGRGVLALLERALVYPQGYPPDQDTATARSFAPSFGAGWFDLLNAAVDLPFGFAFDETEDSNGDAWAETVETSFKVNSSMLDIAEFMTRMGYEWRLNGAREMEVYSDFGAGEDRRSVVIFRQGRDIEFLAQERFSGDLANAVMAIEGAASYAAYVDSSSVTAYARLEAPLNSSGKLDKSLRGETLRDLLAWPRVTYEMVVNSSDYTPLLDYGLGDRVRVWTERVRADFRVMKIQIGQNEGALLVDLTLDDPTMTYMERLNVALRRREMSVARLYGMED
jgi:hypothetical protein